MHEISSIPAEFIFRQRPNCRRRGKARAFSDPRGGDWAPEVFHNKRGDGKFYLMLAIVKKQLQIRKSLNEILQIVSVNIFEQVPLAELPAEEPRVLEQEVGDSRFQKVLLLKDL